MERIRPTYQDVIKRANEIVEFYRAAAARCDRGGLHWEHLVSLRKEAEETLWIARTSMFRGIEFSDKIALWLGRCHYATITEAGVERTYNM